MFYKKIANIIEFITPTFFLRFLLFFWGFFFKYHKSFSQKGEDLIILSYFQGLNITKGVYLDIGCFHPTWISNTHLLHKEGWTGYAIDIDKYKLKAMKFVRGRNIECINGAVTPNTKDDEIVKVFKFKKAWSDFDTLDKNYADMIKDEFKIDYQEKMINSIYINNLFSKLPHINFLNVDIEGLDKEVILNLDLEKYKPDVIVLEDNVWGGSEEINKKMNKNDYNKILVSGNSIGFAKNTTKSNLLNNFNFK